jgi:hypothetical protein
MSCQNRCLNPGISTEHVHKLLLRLKGDILDCKYSPIRFRLVHVHEKIDTIVNCLFWSTGIEENIVWSKADDTQEIEEFSNRQLFTCRIRTRCEVSVSTGKPKYFQLHLISEMNTSKWEEIVCFLEMLKLPEQLTGKQRHLFCT